MINVKTFVFNPFMENTYLIYGEDKKATIIDPGCYDAREKLALSEFIENEGLEVVQLLNTHCHIDHVLGNSFVKDKYGVELGIHKDDLEVLRAVKAYAPSYGFQNYEDIEPDYFLEPGKTVQMGGREFEIIFAPGHAPGHVVFYNEDEKILIGGDVLFRASIGRTDLPGGDHDLLIENIREKIFKLPGDTVVYPGHGENTSIGWEKENNPFCAVV